MSKKKQTKPVGDQVDNPWALPEGRTVADDVAAASEFFDLTPVDFVYNTIADLIIATMGDRRWLKLRARMQKQAVKQHIINHLALLDYGKEIIDRGSAKEIGKIAGEIAKHGRAVPPKGN